MGMTQAEIDVKVARAEEINGGNPGAHRCFQNADVSAKSVPVVPTSPKTGRPIKSKIEYVAIELRYVCRVCRDTWTRIVDTRKKEASN